MKHIIYILLTLLVVVSIAEAQKSVTSSCTVSATVLPAVKVVVVKDQATGQAQVKIDGQGIVQIRTVDSARNERTMISAAHAPSVPIQKTSEHLQKIQIAYLSY